VLRLSLHTHFLPASNHTTGMTSLKKHNEANIHFFEVLRTLLKCEYIYNQVVQKSGLLERIICLTPLTLSSFSVIDGNDATNNYENVTQNVCALYTFNLYVCYVVSRYTCMRACVRVCMSCVCSSMSEAYRLLPYPTQVRCVLVARRNVFKG
jgi:hypothetical protein